MSYRRRTFRLRRLPPVQIMLYVWVRTVFRVVGMSLYAMAPQVGLWLGRLHPCWLSNPLLPENVRGLPDPVPALTQAFTSQFEGCVRAHPERWFWVHDRRKEGEKVAAAARSARPVASGPS